MNAIIRPSKSMWLTFEQIDLPDNGRPYSATDVGALVKSIRTIGLMVPLTVIERNGRYLLVAGRHRLEALRVLGQDQIPVRNFDMDDIEARLWTISENLHRTELSALERSEQVAEFAKLTRERLVRDLPMAGKAPQAGGGGVSAQVGPRPQGAQLGHPQRYEQRGDSLAARELGITRQEVQRAETIASLPDEVKAKAIETGLDRNQSALLQAAKAPTPEAQVEVLERRAERAPTLAPRPAALRNLENLAAGELARWIKITTPNGRVRVIRMLRECAAILEDQLEAARGNG
jgi:ParB family chromosome partitioning protein